jgi:hypothetical protein
MLSGEHQQNLTRLMQHEGNDLQRWPLLHDRPAVRPLGRDKHTPNKNHSTCLAML